MNRMARFSRQLKKYFLRDTLVKKPSENMKSSRIFISWNIKIFDESFSKIDRQMFDAKVAGDMKNFVSNIF